MRPQQCVSTRKLKRDRGLRARTCCCCTARSACKSSINSGSARYSACWRPWEPRDRHPGNNSTCEENTCHLHAGIAESTKQCAYQEAHEQFFCVTCTADVGNTLVSFCRLVAVIHKPGNIITRLQRTSNYAVGASTVGASTAGVSVPGIPEGSTSNPVGRLRARGFRGSSSFDRLRCLLDFLKHRNQMVIQTVRARFDGWQMITPCDGRTLAASTRNIKPVVLQGSVKSKQEGFAVETVEAAMIVVQSSHLRSRSRERLRLRLPCLLLLLRCLSRSRSRSFSRSLSLERSLSRSLSRSCWNQWNLAFAGTVTTMDTPVSSRAHLCACMQTQTSQVYKSLHAAHAANMSI